MIKDTNKGQSFVFVVDDDDSLREALGSLFRSVGLEVMTFASAPAFLSTKLPDAPGCLVLDVRLPGMSGLDFQGELVKANVHLPFVFMTGYGDIPMTVKAMKAGRRISNQAVSRPGPSGRGTGRH
ncbi:MAG TPA: response regulator [Pyrinomonadaceae bacterium]|nr:response regulator [Pyrinomonadaceae bacterium]